LPLENRKPSEIIDTAITAPPRISSGLRPQRSTVTSAISVNTMLATPTMMVCSSALSVDAPMFWNISGA
jgi:hypothetical protein